MILWIVLTMMCSAAAVAASAAFMRRPGAAEAAPADGLAIYRDQLAEIEREEKEGTVAGVQAEAARVEVQRRMLAADRGKPDVRPPMSERERLFAAVAIASVVVLGSVTLYAMNGQPDLPSAATSRRADTARIEPEIAPQSVAATPARASAAAEAGQGTPGQGLATVDEMIARVRTRVERDPNNLADWRMLGWSYFGTQRFAEAAAAYARAVALAPGDASLRAAYGEALVRSEGDQVGKQASESFEAALKIDPKEPRSRFFLGLAKLQAGDTKTAIADWVALLKDATGEDNWAADLRQRVTDVAAEAKISIDGQLPDLPAHSLSAPPPEATASLPSLQTLASAEPTTPAAPADKGPSSEDVRRAEGLSTDQRTAMIRGMVDSLAARLEKEPRDAEGWIKLIRSRQVLGETDAAKAALRKALMAFEGTPQEQSRIASAGRELGLFK